MIIYSRTNERKSVKVVNDENLYYGSLWELSIQKLLSDCPRLGNLLINLENEPQGNLFKSIENRLALLQSNLILASCIKSNHSSEMVSKMIGQGITNFLNLFPIWKQWSRSNLPLSIIWHSNIFRREPLKTNFIKERKANKIYMKLQTLVCLGKH